ncbi:hypothetical protein EXIGLDRAFT_352783 [Exidia glandulosa HHB12029]|uniref:Uncharacterized protein n=1 Tax=Exidia glandulosa HHB12029 TaxID=1314781 RepID=A0A165LC28_EXIGL|nr:hypothetical protein EXIGLDRAFT_352783 [Exidia glandulosa HHB12029]
MVLAPFNVSYSAGSPSFSYIPQRDGDVTTTWNASFTASSVWPAGGADAASGNGFPYRRTQASSASVSFTFIGSALYLCVTPNGAKYAFQVDQTLISSTASGSDPACSTVGAQTTLVAEGLDASQSHTAILTVNAAPGNEFQFLGGQATLGVTSAGQTLGQNVTVDDQAPNWNMFPGRGANQWDSHTGLTGHINNSETFSCLYNPDQPQTATLPFSGAGGVVLYGGIRIAHEFYTITFNGKSYPVDASSQWQEPHLVLFAQGMCLQFSC